MARCGCSGSCSCVLQDGKGIAVTGTGTATDPYIISFAGDQITLPDTFIPGQILATGPTAGSNLVYVDPADFATSSLAGLPPGSVFAIHKPGASWKLGSTTITTRPTARTDLTMVWVAADGSVPAFAIGGDHALPVRAVDINAAPYVLAAGALAVRFVGRGDTLPASGTDGDVFILDTA